MERKQKIRQRKKRYEENKKDMRQEVKNKDDEIRISFFLNIKWLDGRTFTSARGSRKKSF